MKKLSYKKEKINKNQTWSLFFIERCSFLDLYIPMTKKTMFLILFFLFSFQIQAEINFLSILFEVPEDRALLKERNQINKFNDFLDTLYPQIISGEKKQIESAVKELINYLTQNPNKAIHPSVSLHNNQLKQERSFNSTLILTGKSYSLSAKKNHDKIKKAFFPSHVTSHPFDDVLQTRIYYLLRHHKQIRDIKREWTLALIFFSLAGFESPLAKSEYIATFHRFQLFYNSLSLLYKMLEPELNTVRINDLHRLSFQEKILEAEYTTVIREYKSIFNDLSQLYFDIIIPSFLNLSWVNQDLKQSKYPGMLFEYGRILHQAFKNKKSLEYAQLKRKGLHYIHTALEQSYFPSAQYLINSYPQQSKYDQYQSEVALNNYLSQEHLTFFKKIYVIFKLIHLNMNTEKDIALAVKKGVSSLKQSCKSAFKTVR